MADKSRARVRGAITGTGMFVSGFLHTLPFLIPSYTTATVVAIPVVLLELKTPTFLRPVRASPGAFSLSGH
ncbi:MAG: hypothetical protein ACR2JH_07525 [Solirubrobacteraceae bacterium]